MLHPPLRVGRIALFNDTHLTRLRLITSLLDRGYNLAHVNEMLSTWEQGKDLGDMLGLESAIAGTWATEKPQTMTLEAARRLIDDDAAFDRLVALDIVRVEQQQATIVRPTLVDAFTEIHRYGVAYDKLIDIHDQISPLLDQISAILLQAGVEEVLDKINPGAAMPDDVKVAELITTLVRFRTRAVSAVGATLAFSIETAIETTVAQMLGDLVEKNAEAGDE